MSKRVILIILGLAGLFYFVICSNSLYAQKLNELKQKKKAIENEIESITNLLSKTEKESNSSFNNIKLTKRKIELRNNLITQIDNESEEIKSQINYRKIRIDSLNSRINQIKEEYRRVIVYTQRTNIRNSLLLQVLSSKDLNQAYKRLKFYQQVLGYKKEIVETHKMFISSIKEEANRLSENVTLLEKKQNEKASEVKQLVKEESSYRAKIERLNIKKKQLISDLEEQRRISNRLNEEIKKLIEEEARREADRNKKFKNSNLVELSNNFKENVGKFNLPVDKGIITATYGESFHPILKEVKIKNNGVDITITKNSDVYSIFKGEVRKIIKIPGSNLAIIIRHGNFLSVYSNLNVVNVNIGQEIDTYQKIGEINLEKAEETAILHFELWNETKTEDPLKWIRN
jgi:murein hydrolase activator